MAKKLLKKDIVDTLLGEQKDRKKEQQENIQTEKQENIKQEIHKNVETVRQEIRQTEKQETVKVKTTLYLDQEDDTLIDDIRRLLNRNRKGKKFTRSEVVAIALRNYAQELGIELSS